MILIIGLGNPGKKYENTPHNAGFLVLDKIAQRLGLKFKEKLGQSLVIKTASNDEDLILAKPQTYMNNSGNAVLKLKQFYKAANENFIVVHDDIDLPFGKIKESYNSRSAGHKGVDSIIKALDGKNFYRLRLGVCPEKKPEDLENYVTKKIPEKYKDIFFGAIDKAADKLLALCNTSRASHQAK